MSRAVFDTLAAARALRKAEFGERLAEAIASVVCRAVDTDRGEFATKTDLKAGIAVFEARAGWLADGLANLSRRSTRSARCLRFEYSR